MKIINCDCGHVIQADADDELVDRAQEHIRIAHPDLAGKVTAEQLLAMAEIIA
jgi:predicted small metal-binding protein